MARAARALLHGRAPSRPRPTLRRRADALCPSPPVHLSRALPPGRDGHVRQRAPAGDVDAHRGGGQRPRRECVARARRETGVVPILGAQRLPARTLTPRRAARSGRHAAAAGGGAVQRQGRLLAPAAPLSVMLNLAARHGRAAVSAAASAGPPASPRAARCLRSRPRALRALRSRHAAVGTRPKRGPSPFVKERALITHARAQSKLLLPAQWAAGPGRSRAGCASKAARTARRSARRGRQAHAGRRHRAAPGGRVAGGRSAPAAMAPAARVLLALLAVLALLRGAAAQAFVGNFTILVGLQPAPIPKAQLSPSVMGVNMGACASRSGAGARGLQAAAEEGPRNRRRRRGCARGGCRLAAVAPPARGCDAAARQATPQLAPAAEAVASAARWRSGQPRARWLQPGLSGCARSLRLTPAAPGGTCGTRGTCRPQVSRRQLLGGVPAAPRRERCAPAPSWPPRPQRVPQPPDHPARQARACSASAASRAARW